MFDYFALSPKIEEKGSYYLVSGINLRDFEADLRTNFGTSVIFSRVVNRVNARQFRFHKFFSVELCWILDHLVNGNDRRSISRYRVGLHKYKLLLDELKSDTWIKSIFEKHPQYEVDKALKEFNYPPFPDQRNFLEQYSSIKYGYQLRGCLLDAAAGSGKAVTLDTPVRYPGQWKPMGEVKLGDVIIGADGLPTEVTGVYPQPKLQIYKITFADGRTARCCKDHLWKVSDSESTTSVWSVNKTSYLIDYLNSQYGNNKLYIPLIEPENYPDTGLPFDPFELGKSLGEHKYLLKEKFKLDKFIPEQYFNSSIKQRWELINGLMHSSGFLSSKGLNPYFQTESELLAKQMAEIIHGLGGFAKVVSRCDKKDNVLYRVWIRVKDPKKLWGEELFKHYHDTAGHENIKLRILSIEEGGFEEAQCISVDNKDRLFVIGGYVVTHNTYTSMVWSTMISEGKTIVIVPKHLVNKPWVDEVTSKHFRNPRKCWTTLDKTSYLDNLDADYFIIHKDALRSGEFLPLVKAVTKGGKIPAKVIVDECHNYNEPNSQQTRALIELCSDPAISDVLFMSGTPIKAQGRETFALFTIIDKYFDRYVRDDFLKMYGRDNAFLNEMLAHRLGQVKYTIAAIKEMDAPPEPEIVKVSFPGCENFTLENIRVAMMEFIKDRIDYYRKMMPRYLADFNNFIEDYELDIRYDEDALADLKKYRLIVDRFHRKGYNNFTDSEDSKFCKSVENRIEEGLRGEDLKYFRHIKSAVKYVNLKIRGEALGNVLGKARMAAVRETIRHARLPEMINSVKKKTVLYTSYVEVIKELERYFEELEEFRSISVFGENSKEVDQVIKKIESDKTINPLITTFNTLREGYPLLFANQIIMLNSPFRSYELTQTIARIHRRGQDEECFVKLIDLDTGDKENITSRTINIMEWSQNQIDVLLGGGNLGAIDPATMNGLIGAESLGSDGKFDYFKFKEHFDLECDETPNHYPKFKPKTNLGSIF